MLIVGNFIKKIDKKTNKILQVVEVIDTDSAGYIGKDLMTGEELYLEFGMVNPGNPGIKIFKRKHKSRRCAGWAA